MMEQSFVSLLQLLSSRFFVAATVQSFLYCSNCPVVSLLQQLFWCHASFCRIIFFFISLCRYNVYVGRWHYEIIWVIVPGCTFWPLCKDTHMGNDSMIYNKFKQQYSNGLHGVTIMLSDETETHDNIYGNTTSYVSPPFCTTAANDFQLYTFAFCNNGAKWLSGAARKTVLSLQFHIHKVFFSRWRAFWKKWKWCSTLNLYVLLIMSLNTRVPFFYGGKGTSEDRISNGHRRSAACQPTQMQWQILASQTLCQTHSCFGTRTIVSSFLWVWCSVPFACFVWKNGDRGGWIACRGTNVWVAAIVERCSFGYIYQTALHPWSELFHKRTHQPPEWNHQDGGPCDCCNVFRQPVPPYEKSQWRDEPEPVVVVACLEMRHLTTAPILVSHPIHVRRVVWLLTGMGMKERQEPRCRSYSWQFIRFQYLEKSKDSWSQEY